MRTGHDMRILHTSDWHIGRVFHHASLLEDQQHSLAQFVELARELRPDVVVIAGDLYDRAVPPGDAVEVLDEVLCRLVLDLKLPTLAIAGNHDSAERVGFASRLLAERGLYVVGNVGRPGQLSLTDAHGQVDFVGLPYAPPEAVRSVLQDDTLRGHEAALAAQVRHACRGLAPGRRRVAVAHAFVTSALTSESERPLSVGGTGAVPAEVFDGFHYVALGHLHRPQSLHGGRLRYSGSLLQYSFSELDHAKSVSLVDLGRDGEVQIEQHPLTPRRPLRRIQGTFEEIVAAAAQDAAREDYVLICLEDTAPVLDAVARLRVLYPNILNMERTRFAFEADAARPHPAEHQRTGPEDLFAAFYKDVTGEALLEAETRVVANAIAALDAAHAGES
jgi:exonuclease SbcD